MPPQGFQPRPEDAPPPPPLRTPDYTPFLDALENLSPGRISELDTLVPEAGISELQRAMTASELSAEELALYYLWRIRTYDVGNLQAVVELNPQALEQARDSDEARAGGLVRSPLHGIPILIKDNIAAGPEMHVTAGAAALLDFRPDSEAFLISALRDAGAVVLGKTNLSEWANYMSTKLPNGYSAVGGKTFSPYRNSIDPLGSSTGSAVAVTTNFAAAAIGTETAGSVIAPAAVNSVVGVHPSLGLVSRSGVIPLSDEMDTAGPLARTVADAAILLSALSSRVDSADRFAPEAASLTDRDVTRFLDRDALRGKRIGLLLPDKEDDLEKPEAILERVGFEPAAEAFRRAGAELVLIPARKPEIAYRPVLDYGLREGLRGFLALHGSNAPVRTLEEVTAFNRSNPERYAYYGQDLLESAQSSLVDETEYRRLGASNRATAQEYLRALLDEHQLDGLVSINNTFSLLYAAAGFPAVTVPAGLEQDGGVPYGVTFIGNYLEDGAVLGMAYAFEQAGRLRVPPVFP